MSVNLLATDTVNFLDLVGNGRVYVVPAYQRDYSWEEEHWEYTLTQGIAALAPEEWTPAHIDRRQEQMAARAAHIWRCDY